MVKWDAWLMKSQSQMKTVHVLVLEDKVLLLLSQGAEDGLLFLQSHQQALPFIQFLLLYSSLLLISCTLLPEDYISVGPPICFGDTLLS